MQLMTLIDFKVTTFQTDTHVFGSGQRCSTSSEGSKSAELPRVAFRYVSSVPCLKKHLKWSRYFCSDQSEASDTNWPIEDCVLTV